jgi:hypothetical protein
VDFACWEKIIGRWRSGQCHLQAEELDGSYECDFMDVGSLMMMMMMMMMIMIMIKKQKMKLNTHTCTIRYNIDII